jgi:hypothetical protein
MGKIRPRPTQKHLAEIETRTDRILGDLEKVRALLTGPDGLEVDVLTQLQAEKLAARLWRAQDAVTLCSEEVARKAKQKGF